MPSRAKHIVLPVQAVEHYDAPATPHWHESGWRVGMRKHNLLKLSFLVVIALFCFSTSIHVLPRRVLNDSAPPLGLPKDVQTAWGQYSPYFPVDIYLPPPTECVITQVNILQRHGARFPNSFDTYDQSIRKLLSVKKYKDPRLDFLEEYEYDLSSEKLTSFGAAQSFNAGEETFKRYSHIISEDNIPFVRATRKSRVIESATNWTVGFAATSQQRYNPFLDLAISENQNSTLNENCPNANDGTQQKDEWLSVFAPPIAQRIEEAAPGASLTNNDVFNLMAMCPFETIAKRRPSEFCGLFTKEEFREFEYHGDVEKYYKTGYGESLGPVQGVGYVNELIARITGRPVQDDTSHNDSLPFPLGRSTYTDFTHENLMVGVFSAMGLFNTSTIPLSTKRMDTDREWVASKMVPFSARMVVEKMTCGGVIGRGFEKEFVRILVNDAVQPLEFCGGGRVKMCTLDAFVRSQGYSRGPAGKDWRKCFN